MSVDHCVTGVQTCALPISIWLRQFRRVRGLCGMLDAWGWALFAYVTLASVWFWRSEERRVGNECRSLCDWSSDVCSSDLDLAAPVPPGARTVRHARCLGLGAVRLRDARQRVVL